MPRWLAPQEALIERFRRALRPKELLTPFAPTTPTFDRMLGNGQMTTYQETQRITCTGRTGRHYVVIEQIRISRSLARDAAPASRIDYITEEGDVADKLDDDHFLLLMSKEVIHRA
jgi:hypothetical protein